MIKWIMEIPDSEGGELVSDGYVYIIPMKERNLEFEEKLNNLVSTQFKDVSKELVLWAKGGKDD